MTALSSHPAQVLEELNLGYNSIGDKSIEYIAEYIKVNIPINIVCITCTIILFLCSDGKLSLEDIGSELH